VEPAVVCGIRPRLSLSWCEVDPTEHIPRVAAVGTTSQIFPHVSDVDLARVTVGESHVGHASLPLPLTNPFRQRRLRDFLRLGADAPVAPSFPVLLSLVAPFDARLDDL